MKKDFSASCERNQQPILKQLSHYFKACPQVFEIGSGTGQHAVYFAKNLPHLLWYTSDMQENHGSIKAWLKEHDLPNIIEPIEFTIGKHEWPEHIVDAVFTANTTHIMQREEAQLMMEMVGKNLKKGGIFCQYGPMNVNNDYTSDSNRDFDKRLKDKGCGGICDIAELVQWAQGLSLIKQVSMPANNFLLVWKSI